MNVRRAESVPVGLNNLDHSYGKPYIDKLWRIHEVLDTLRGHMSKQSLNVELSEMTEENGEEPAVLPPTYLVLQLNPDTPSSALKWLVDKIKGQRRDGGAELVLLKQPTRDNEPLYLHVSASRIKFLEAAEEMEMVKMDIHGKMREFSVAQLEEFLPDGMLVEDLLTLSERQMIVMHELDNIRALAEDDHIPGYPSYTLYEGQSIMNVCQDCNIIFKIYSLHDREELKKLGRKWYLSVFRKQPFEEIRMYFGEAIALYFTFLGFYTTALIIPMTLGFLQLLLSTETVAFFCIFNVVWMTVFLELWRRKSNELAFKWGTIGMTSLDEPRSNYRGEMGVDPVTGRIQPQYPRWKTNVKMYCVSFPVVFVCMVTAFIIMLISFWAEDYFRQMDSVWTDQLVNIPSIVYAGLVCVMNVYYRKLATFLAEWENHRTQSQYERHRVTKLVLFEFVNNFMSLFYIAFYIQDFEMLKSQCATMLIISQAVNNLQEVVLPFVTKFYMTKVAQLKTMFSFGRKKDDYDMKKTFVVGDHCNPFQYIPELQMDDPRIEAAIREGELEDYEGTYDDYLEMYIQFGYVVLFSSVYPIAAFWAILNNILEIRADAFKLCMVFQRPLGRRVKDIGAWQRAFEVVGAMSILTNCGVLCLSPQMRRAGPDVGQIEWILMFVFLEHILIGIRYILHITIPERPEWVRVALAKRNHESKQALKYERAQRNRRLLTRRFKSVHGLHGQ